MSHPRTGKKDWGAFCFSHFLSTSLFQFLFFCFNLLSVFCLVSLTSSITSFQINRGVTLVYLARFLLSKSCLDFSPSPMFQPLSCMKKMRSFYSVLYSCLRVMFYFLSRVFPPSSLVLPTSEWLYFLVSLLCS